MSLLGPEKAKVWGLYSKFLRISSQRQHTIPSEGLDLTPMRAALGTLQDVR
jgi:hypothetical protein